ncbi:MAG TPA: citrate synthase [Solirubrobacterales bacterium]|nr:citrate synthase [Solirubrobacterales bacterium]
MSDADERLGTEEVARRLGVKRETVYAYVSRGLLERHPASGPHDSRSDPEEVERLAARARRPDRSSALEVVVETELTLLDPAGRLSYRGRDAIELARFRSFEEVVALLWDGAPPTPWGLDDERAAAIAALSEALGPEAPDAERIAAVVATLAARDPARDDREPESARRAGAEVFAGILAALAPGRGAKPSYSDGKSPQPRDDEPATDPEDHRARIPSHLQVGGDASAMVTGAPEKRVGPVGGAADIRPDHVEPVRSAAAGRHSGPERSAADAKRVEPKGNAAADARRGPTAAALGIAEQLWVALAADASAKPRPEQVSALNAVLILLADHELAASTFAARVAASAWAGPYRVILAGLGPLGGALHGGAGLAVEALLDEVVAGTDPGAALDAAAANGPVPGFGHRVYRDRDPRADHLLERLGLNRGRPLAPCPERGRPLARQRAKRRPRQTGRA